MFGKLNGLRVFVNLKLNRPTNLQIPGISSKIFMRTRSSDIETFAQIFVYNEYHVDFVDNPKVIIDGGANIGLFTVFIKNRFPESKVICIEPDSENFEWLKKNVSSYKDVFCENRGLWKTEINLKVYDKLNMGKWGLVVEETTEEGNVKGLSINSIINKYSIDKIDILKLDIEGSEKNLFSGEYLEWLSKTRMVIIELHDFLEEGCSKPFFIAINNAFNKYDYMVKGENTIVFNKDI